MTVRWLSKAAEHLLELKDKLPNWNWPHTSCREALLREEEKFHRAVAENVRLHRRIEELEADVQASRWVVAMESAGWFK